MLICFLFSLCFIVKGHKYRKFALWWMNRYQYVINLVCIWFVNYKKLLDLQHNIVCKMISSNQYIKSLDGVRGLAILIILVHHHFSIPGGWLGVDLFFVLSGFLITGILNDSKGKENFFKNFYARRIIRIFPLYYFLLISFFFLSRLVVNLESKPLFQVYFTDSHMFWLYMQNWAQVLNLLAYENCNRLLTHLWSLAIEEQFYLVWPFFVFFFNLRQLKTITISLIFLSFLTRIVMYYYSISWEVVYLNTFTRIDTILVGSLIAILFKSGFFVEIKQSKLNVILLLLTFLTILFFIASPIRNPNTGIFIIFGYSFFAFFFGMLILVLVTGKNIFLKRLFEFKWLIYLGKRSYSIYLFHYPIFFVLLMLQANPKIESMLDEVKFNYVIQVLSIISAIVFSQITWFFLEKPVSKLKSNFKYD